MMQRAGRMWVFLGVGLVAGNVVTACEPQTSTTGGGDNSETHFLVTCEGSCAGGLECLCGVCTKPCTENDSVCGELSTNATCGNSCDAEPAVKTCDVRCNVDAECAELGSDFACLAGGCRVQADPPADACQAKADPAPMLVPSTELAPDMVALAAVVLGSCMPDDGIDRSASHMWLANLNNSYNAAQARCLAESRCGCAAMKECYGYEQVAIEPSECAPGCKDGVITGCGDDYDLREGISISWDCKKLGRTCAGASVCSQEGAEVCEPGTPRSCLDGRPVTCEGGVLRQGPDCASLGLACEEGRCVGTGAVCQGETQPDEVAFVGVSCENDVLQACLGGFDGKLASVNCAEQGPGFTCQSVMSKPFCGLASECLPAMPGAPSASHPPSCDGAVITFCNAGRLEHIDCADLGFTGCEVNRGQGLYGCTPGLNLR